MERFDDYWGEPAYIKDVTFKICANADTIVMDLEGGSIDMFARVTSTQAAELSDNFNVLEGTMNRTKLVALRDRGESGSTSYALPEDWDASKVHVYCFATTKNGRSASDSLLLQ